MYIENRYIYICVYIYIYLIILNIKWVPQNSVPIADVSVDYILDLDAWTLYIYKSQIAAWINYDPNKNQSLFVETQPEVPPFFVETQPLGHHTEPLLDDNSAVTNNLSKKWAEPSVTLAKYFGQTFCHQTFSQMDIWVQPAVSLPFFWKKSSISSANGLWTFLWRLETAAPRPRLQGFLLSFTHLHLLLTRSLLENLPAARSKNRRSTSKNIDWRIKEATKNSQNVDHSLSCSNANAWGFGLHKGPP